MPSADPPRFSDLVAANEATLLADWMKQQKAARGTRLDLLGESELEGQSRRFLRAFRVALATGDLDDIAQPAWQVVRDFLREVSRSRALQGFKPSETALFAAGPWLKPKGKAHTERPVAGAVVQFITAIYGGFFGAGMGIMMLATLGLTENGD